MWFDDVGECWGFACDVKLVLCVFFCKVEFGSRMSDEFFT